MFAVFNQISAYNVICYINDYDFYAFSGDIVPETKQVYCWPAPKYGKIHFQLFQNCLMYMLHLVRKHTSHRHMQTESE